MSPIHLTETVRDALQGIEKFIPTAKKIEYIRALLKVGFDCIDIGSFVSPKAVPQMAETAQVIQNLNFTDSKTKAMVLVVNEQGAERATQFPFITDISYPYSVSPTFLQRNLKMDTVQSKKTINSISESVKTSRLNFVVYLSMGFGNPYGDDWSLNLLTDTVREFYKLGIRKMPLSDILGEASPERIFEVYNTLIPPFPDVDFGLHLHTKPTESYAKLESAYEAGVRSFETVLNGLGGCPFAANEMVGNLSTQDFVAFCDKKNIPLNLDRSALAKAIEIASGLTN